MANKFTYFEEKSLLIYIRQKKTKKHTYSEKAEQFFIIVINFNKTSMA